MSKQEAAITKKIEVWFAKTVDTSSPFEIKHTRGATRFNLRELKKHQVDWLLACSSEKGCTWKIPDTGYGYNPFDCFHYKNAPSYVVIAYPKWICAIHIQDIVVIGGSSLDEETAVQISAFKILTKEI